MPVESERAKRARRLNEIEQVAINLLVQGESVTLSQIAREWAMSKGEIEAMTQTEALAPALINDRLRRDRHMPVIAVERAVSSAEVENMDDDELASVVAGIGHASKTQAIYWPLRGDDDLVFIRHAIHRYQSKNMAHVDRDVANQGLSAPAQGKVLAARNSSGNPPLVGSGKP